MTRKEFVAKVAEATQRSQATVSQVLYAVGFKPNERMPGTGRYAHMMRPRFAEGQVTEAVSIVLRNHVSEE